MSAINRRGFLRGTGLMALAASPMMTLARGAGAAILPASSHASLQWLGQSWLAEIEQPAQSKVYVRDNRLWLDSRAGMTVWLARPLSGRYRIEYTREVFAAGAGANARLSDLNQFWAARDPQRSEFFTRSGALAEYNALDLYYVGFGGNSNTTTRFRHYDGSSQRPLLGEYTDPPHLLKPAHRYRVRTDVLEDRTSFWIDGKRWFEHVGEVAAGYFGLRTTWSLQAVSDFKVTAL